MNLSAQARAVAHPVQTDGDTQSPPVLSVTEGTKSDNRRGGRSMTVIRPSLDLPYGRPAAPSPASARLRAHWEALRTGAALPRRDQFEPRRLGSLLGSIFLVDWTDQGTARLGIAGQVFARLYGMELHGAPLALLFEPSERAAIGRMMARVCDGPVAVDLGLRSEGGAGRPPITGKMMVLPLLDRSGAPNLAIGTLEVTGSTGRTPRRFRVERCLWTAPTVR